MKPGTRAYVLLAVGLIALLAFTPSAFADGAVKAELVADPVELTVGEVVRLTLVVTHPAGYRISPVILPREWGDFEVRSQSRPQTSSSGDGTETTTQTIEAAIFSPGEFTTPELTVTIQDNLGQTFDGLVTPVSLTVISVLKKGDESLRDIRPQAILPLPALWPWILGATLVVLAVGLAGWVMYRRMRRKAALPPAQKELADLRSPYEIAIDELARIEGMRLPDDGRFKEHYTLASDTLRRFLDGEHQVAARDQTTEEVRHLLGQTAIGRQHSFQLMAVLSECDLVKFARHVPEAGNAHGIVSEIRQLVELTRVAPTAESSVDGATSRRDGTE